MARQFQSKLLLVKFSTISKADVINFQSNYFDMKT